MKFYQRDIVLVPFPYTNLSNFIKRPAIIISNERVNLTDDLILAQVTSTLRNDIFSFQLDNSFLTNPLPAKSEVRMQKIFTISKSLVIKNISSINEYEFKKLIENVIKLIDITILNIQSD
jgi:mRNA interferase MazF